MIDTTKIVQALRVDGTPMTLAGASGGSQDYQIVTAEPEDKSQGKMIYEKSSGVTFGKSVINKTLVDEFYSSPSDFFGKFSDGTATASDMENYEYLLSSSNGYVTGYINIGNLPELTQYLASHNSFNLLYKVNGGEEQIDTLTLDTNGIFYVGTKLTVMRTNKLGETTGVSDDYYSVTMKSDSFEVATTDTIEVTRLNLNGNYVIVEKEGSEGPFAIANLKIADGTKYNSLKDYLGGSPLYKHELVIPYSFSVTDSETVDGSVTYHYLSNTETQITNVSEIDDNFMLSGGIGKNSGSDALTWVINEKPSVPDKMFSVKFTSNAIRYNNIGLSPTGDALPGISGVLIAYHREEDGMFDQVYEIYQGTERWSSQAYRTVTFETAPSGELLTWLQANAVPQGGASTTTVLLLNVNVIKAGSSITVEAVNASTMGYITGTVGTITDTVTQLI